MSINRRSFLMGSAAFGGGTLLPPLARGAISDPEKSAVAMMTEETDTAIDSGLRFLSSRQHDDGAFGSGGTEITSMVAASGG